MNTHPSNDQLSTRLREEARHYDPQPPPHLRRALLTALAGAPSPASRPRPIAPWMVTAGALAAAAVIAAILFRAPPAITPAPSPIVKSHPQPATPLPTPNLLAFTQRYVDEPLETEMKNLLTDLSQTSQTVLRILPAASKRSKPTTTGV